MGEGMMNKYKLMGAVSAVIAAGVCFYAYYRGGAQMYGATLILASAAFAFIGYSELMISKESGTGTFGYIKPVFYFILAVVTVAASVWFFLSRS